MSSAAAKINIGNEEYTAEDGFTSGISFPARVVDLSGGVRPEHPEDCVGVLQGATPGDSIRSILKTGVWSAIQATESRIDERLRIAADLVTRPFAFFEDPARMILRPGHGQPITVRSWTFRASSEKNHILGLVQQCLNRVQSAKAVMESAVHVADELFTNAVFNAPFGDAEYALDRSMVVVLDPNMAAKIIVAYTQDNLFIGCVDTFGTLDCEEVLERLKRYFEKGGDDSLNMGAGGAGIGLLRMVDLAPSIFISVLNRKHTIVGCTFPLGVSSKKVRSLPKDFFIQGYSEWGEGPAKLRVEKRQSKLLLRIIGALDASTPLHQIDAVDVKDAVLDFHLLECIDDSTLHKLAAMWTAGNRKGVTVTCDYVPAQFIGKVLEWAQKSSPEIQVRSVVYSVNCESCSSPQKVLFTRSSAGSSPFSASGLFCPSCRSPLQVK